MWHDDTDDVGALGVHAMGIGATARAVTRRWPVLILAAALTAGGVFFIGNALPKRFVSVAWLRITSNDERIFNTKPSQVPQHDPQQAVLVSLGSPELNSALDRALNHRNADIDSVTGTALEQSPLIRVDVTARTASLAAAAANATANFVVADRNAHLAKALVDLSTAQKQQAEGLQPQIAAIGKKLVDARVHALAVPEDPANEVAKTLTAQQGQLNAQYATLLADASVNSLESKNADAGVEFYQPGSIAGTADFPKPFGWAALAGLAALVLTAAALYASEELHGTFRDSDTAESQRIGARVFGSLSNQVGAERGSRITSDELALQLASETRSSTVSVLALAHVEGDAPAESTGRNISLALARGGSRVLYAPWDANARPAADLGDHFDSDTPHSYVDRIAETLDLGNGGSLSMLDGGFGRNMGLGDVRALLSELGPKFDRIVVSVPPPTAEPVSAIVCSLADGTVLFADRRRTQLRGAERVVNRVRELGGRVLGVVVLHKRVLAA